MSEEKRKEKHEPKFTSAIALIAGIVTFLLGLLMVPAILWLNIYPEAGHDFDFIGMFLVIVYVVSWLMFFPLVAIGLVLSIFTLFIGRNKYLRFLPLAFVLVGFLLYALSYAFE
jgi:hypothetical protein